MATIGRTAQGPNEDPGFAGYKSGSKFTPAAGQEGPASSLSLWLKIFTSPVVTRAMIYSDAAGVPGNLLGASADKTLTLLSVAQLATWPLPNVPLAAGVPYWFCVGFDSGGGAVAIYDENSGTGAHSYIQNPAATTSFGVATVAAGTGDLDISVVTSGVANLPDNAAAVAAGYVRSQRSTTQLSTTTYLTEYSIVLNPPGQSPTRFGAAATSLVSQAAADAAALNALNANRRARYAGSAGLPSGSLVVPNLHGDILIPDVN